MDDRGTRRGDSYAHLHAEDELALKRFPRAGRRQVGVPLLRPGPGWSQVSILLWAAGWISAHAFANVYSMHPGQGAHRVTVYPLRHRPRDRAEARVRLCAHTYHTKLHQCGVVAAHAREQ